jgi:nucleoside-diphosphate-sugar epimerase
MKNLIKVAQKNGVKKIVLTSSVGVTTDEFNIFGGTEGKINKLPNRNLSLY